MTSDGKLGPATFNMFGGKTTERYQLAVCVPPPKPPPPPPPPLSKNPCIRFGHTIPVDHHVDVEISQPGPPAISHTWNNFKFADFSDWVQSLSLPPPLRPPQLRQESLSVGAWNQVNVFKPGSGTIKVWENSGGKRGELLYSLPNIPLTPGCAAASDLQALWP